MQCSVCSLPARLTASGRAANKNVAGPEQRRMHVFGARVPRRGEAGARELRGEDVGRVSQFVCVAGRVSRCGGCRHAGVTCAESSSRVADPLYLANGAGIMAVVACRSDSRSAQRGTPWAARGLAWRCRGIGERNGGARHASPRPVVDGCLVPVLGGTGAARRADANPGVGGEASAVLPDEARLRGRAPVVRGADAARDGHAATMVPGAR
jgi:hypothetical protein